MYNFSLLNPSDTTETQTPARDVHVPCIVSPSPAITQLGHHFQHTLPPLLLIHHRARHFRPRHSTICILTASSLALSNQISLDYGVIGVFWWVVASAQPGWSPSGDPL